jgi:UDP-N-acetylmuramoylalanine--D-glutamate ligase
MDTKISDKRILILGFRREGASTLRFLRKALPSKNIGVADKLPLDNLDSEFREMLESDNNLELHLGDDYLKYLDQYDIIFKSAGIKYSLPEIIKAKDAGKLISSNINLFLEYCPGVVIGVTGTKGKSTTASLIHQVLSNHLGDVRLTGNIGEPPTSALENATEDTVFVVELSSFQLAGTNKSPHIAVLQNIIPEHQDFHGGFDSYVDAKAHITRYQTTDDNLIYNSSCQVVRNIASKTKAEKISFGLDKEEGLACYLEDNALMYRSGEAEEKVIDVTDIPLKGKFNLYNVMPAIILGKLFGVPSEAIKRSIKEFVPLEHRLEFVMKLNGVSFYNDSLSTVPQSAIAALQVFPNNNIILIAGGYDRGQEFTDLALQIHKSNVRSLILFPSTGQAIWQELSKHEQAEVSVGHFFVENMQSAVRKAHEIAKIGDIVLLSPASASFGIFKNHQDRGNQFKEEVAGLAK